MNDDEIQRALDTGPASEPNPLLIEQAFAAGVARRRRRMWATSAVAVAVMVIGGAAVAAVALDDDGALVAVDPTVVHGSTIPPATAPGTSAVAESLPPDAPPTSIAGAPTPTPTPSTGVTTTTEDAVTTTTTAAGTVAPSTTAVITTQPLYEPLPPTAPPCPSSMVPNQTLVNLVADGAPPKDETFFAARSDADQWTTELWTADRRWGSVRFDVPDGYWHCFRTTSVLDYDGRWLWIAITSDPACPCTARPSIVVRADTTNGDLRTMWTTFGPQNVLDVLPDGEGGALVLTGPALPGAPFVALYDVASTADGSNQAPIDAWNAPRSDIWVGEIAPDGSRVAYAWSDPATSTAELYLDRVGPPGLEVIPQPIDLTSRMFFVADVDWSADSTRLLVEHNYEGTMTFRLDAVAADPLSTLEDLATHACELPDGSLVTADWSYVIDAPPILGDIVHTAGGHSTILAPSVDGGDLVCLPSGHVVWVQFGGDPPSPTYRIADMAGQTTTIDLRRASDEWPIIYRW